MADEKTAYRYLEEIGLEPIEQRSVLWRKKSLCGCPILPSAPWKLQT